GSPLPEIPFDDLKGVIPNREGRVIDIDGAQIPGVYATGWIKRGPVGLIGHTKSDASETVRHLVEDVTGAVAASEGAEAVEGDLEAGRVAPHGSPEAVLEFLTERGVDVVQWADWEVLDAHERTLGEPHGRERVKVVPREDMIRIARRQTEAATEA
ncbi:pyridine nucleotide-disulfide oxidoreductase, partial [Oerskovia jenensis]